MSDELARSTVEEAATETALIIECPAAEAAVGRHRARHDWSAGVGVPAHVTVLYPFRAPEALSAADHERLTALFATVPAFHLRGERTAWFGEEVVYVAPDDPEPVLALMSAVTDAFPDCPPYGGIHEVVIPHLTVGDNSPVEELRAAEREVAGALPFVQEVTEIALWHGPAAGRPAASPSPGWRRVRAYPLG